MPIWLFVIVLLILISLSILFSTLFFRANRNNYKKDYPDRSIRKFLSNNQVAIYGILAAFMILSLIAVASTYAM